jgi:prophage maintenance system killer protein
VATNVFLILNGLEIEAPETEVVDTILRVADGRMSRNRFATWIRQVMVPYAE